MNGKKRILMIVLLTPLYLCGCFRGRPSEKPPIHLVPDMDDQPKYKAYQSSEFFKDHSAMRLPVAGTVAREFPVADKRTLEGREEDGDFVARSPVAITLPLLQRGQERYNIFCAPCHSQVGDGQGIMIKKGYIPPPTFHSDRLRQLEDGYLFEVISHGIRNMPAYGPQVPVDDRWAIVGYIRALQRSQHATRRDVPEQLLEKMR